MCCKCVFLYGRLIWGRKMLTTFMTFGTISVRILWSFVDNGQKNRPRGPVLVTRCTQEPWFPVIGVGYYFDIAPHGSCKLEILTVGFQERFQFAGQGRSFGPSSVLRPVSGVLLLSTPIRDDYWICVKLVSILLIYVRKIGTQKGRLLVQRRTSHRAQQDTTKKSAIVDTGLRLA